MTNPFPTGVDLVRETVRVTRAVVAGERGHAQRLVELGQALARQSSETYRVRQDGRPNSGSAAIDLMRAVGNSARACTVGEVRAALADRPGMAPHLRLRSLRLATLPDWSLVPDDDSADIVVYGGGGTAVGLLWTAIATGDEEAIARRVTTLEDIAVHGAGESWWARGLGD
ncbi:hypothetical protein [Streptomyces sp. NRRL S-31]|uniref:hypothetical protein n=1 Tax=Streptomyces sp. NRRL S-31 TaxID=1463898 RepID=UPI0004C53F5C|nr:hypothetical protein [Streptomyces sp. NRRL S-31]